MPGKAAPAVSRQGAGAFLVAMACSAIPVSGTVSAADLALRIAAKAAARSSCARQRPPPKSVRGAPALEAEPVALRPLPRRGNAGFPDRPRGWRLNRSAGPFDVRACDVRACANGQPFAQKMPSIQRPHCRGRRCRRSSRGVGDRGDPLHIRIPRRLILGRGIVDRGGLGGHRLAPD